MIKWFDVNQFLPGKEVNHVLIRYLLDEFINYPYYEVGSYEESVWIPMAEKSGYERVRVTHWAFIEEPL